MKTNLSFYSVLLVCTLGAPNALTAAGVAGRGELLYDSQCTSCHEASVHNRASRLATDYAGVVAQVRRWSDAISSGFSDKDINDVASYLNARYYRFPCPVDYCKVTGALPGGGSRQQRDPT